MRQQFADPTCRLRGKALHHILQVRMRFVPVDPGRVHQAHDRRRPLAGAQRTGEQPVRPAVNGCQEPLLSGFESAVLILGCSGLW